MFEILDVKILFNRHVLKLWCRYYLNGVKIRFKKLLGRGRWTESKRTWNLKIGIGHLTLKIMKIFDEVVVENMDKKKKRKKRNKDFVKILLNLLSQ